ncbi:MAG TPA: peroxiredoxin-like family protein [Pseudonocardia sp.]|jgi:peroxiredoxin
MTTTETIATRVGSMLRSTAGQLPPEALAAFGAEQAGLAAAGLPAGIAAVGTPVPDAGLLDVDGRPTTLADARAGRPAVIVFYRGAWCPYCNVALRAYQADLLPALAERGIGLIAVSPQRPDGSLSAREANELTFSVLSDPGNQLSRALGILTRPGADALAAQRTLGLDLTEVNADGTAELPMPTVTVVAGDGTLRWIDVHPDYSTRTEVADILAAVGTL